MGIRGNDGGGGSSGGRSSGGKNIGVWGRLIVEGDGSVGSNVCGVVFHIAAFVF